MSMITVAEIGETFTAPFSIRVGITPTEKYFTYKKGLEALDWGRAHGLGDLTEIPAARSWSEQMTWRYNLSEAQARELLPPGSKCREISLDVEILSAGEIGLSRVNNFTSLALTDVGLKRVLELMKLQQLHQKIREQNSEIRDLRNQVATLQERITELETDNSDKDEEE